jgi:demethylmenaquinone methyltransferase/2-methoxy-6-polyprenyl-1,4-benzoquinol methylase
LTFRLARQVGNTGKVYGIDFSCNLLATAKERSEKYYPQPPITWIEADVLNLPFDDHQFDAITMGYGLRNVVDIPRSLQEIYRVLKPGGTAAILDFHRPSNQIFLAFQQWYLDNLVVPLATNLGVKDEYAYISPSLDRFPIGQEQVEIAYKVGFVNATHYPISNGMMGVLVIRKS